MKIAVTGATGHLGGAVARRLAEQGADLRVVVRDAARAPRLDGAEVAVADYGDEPAIRAAFDGVDVLYLVSASESADRLGRHRTAVAAAAAAGVRRVVYTSFLGAAADSTFTLARDHHHTERALEEAGLPFVALRNSLYADVLPYFAADGVIAGPAGDGRLAPIARADIVDVSLAVLEDESIAGPLDVTGPELLDLHQVAEILSQVRGEPVRYVAETVEEAYASRARYGAPEWQVEAWVSTYEAIARGELAVVSDVVERLTGHPPRSLREVVAGQAQTGGR